MTTAIEHLQSTLNGLGLKAVEARLENLFENMGLWRRTCKFSNVSLHLIYEWTVHRTIGDLHPTIYEEWNRRTAVIRQPP